MIERGRSRHGDERGFVLLWFALVIFVLLVVTALVVDILHGYAMVQRVQNAADAAALAGAQQLPENRSGAQATATSVVLENTDGSVSSIAFEGPPTLRENQIKVTVEDDFDTFFGRAIGIDSLKVKRSALAEFDPPVAIGNPRSTLGNAPGAPPGFVQPLVWATVAGPAATKGGGNAAMSRYCNLSSDPTGPGWSGVPAPSDNCDASHLNSDHENAQYFVVDKRTGAGATLNLELFDPAWINTRESTGHCANEAATKTWEVATGSDPTSPLNPARAEYCTGDQYFRFNNAVGAPWDPTAVPPGWDPWTPYTTFPSQRDRRYRELQLDDQNRSMTTTFELFAPDDTPSNPYDNAAGAPIAGCARTYGGHGNPWLAYEASLAGGASFATYHQWTVLCSHGGPPGKYTLKVSTGPAMTSAGSNTGGVGANNFSIAASTVPGNRYVDADVSVYAVDRMALFANDPTNSGDFYLARVLPSSVARTLRVTFFDMGDILCVPGVECTNYSITARIFPDGVTVGPSGPALTALNNCRFTPPSNAVSTLPVAPWKPDAPPWGPFSPTAGNCTLTDIRRGTYSMNDGYDGQYVTVDIPIPAESGYFCNVTDPNACWLKIHFTTTSHTFRPAPPVSDVTTWIAGFSGDPSRIIE